MFCLAFCVDSRCWRRRQRALTVVTAAKHWLAFQGCVLLSTWGTLPEGSILGLATTWIKIEECYFWRSLKTTKKNLCRRTSLFSRARHVFFEMLFSLVHKNMTDWWLASDIPAESLVVRSPWGLSSVRRGWTGHTEVLAAPIVCATALCAPSWSRREKLPWLLGCKFNHAGFCLPISEFQWSMSKPNRWLMFFLQN